MGTSRLERWPSALEPSITSLPKRSHGLVAQAVRRRAAFGDFSLERDAERERIGGIGRIGSFTAFGLSHAPYAPYASRPHWANA